MAAVPPIFADLFALAVEHAASDLHLKVGRPALVRVAGQLVETEMSPFTAAQLADFIEATVPAAFRARWLADHQVDYSLDLGASGQGRYRVNAYIQRGQPALALRLVKSNPPDFAALNHDPKSLGALLAADQGLVLVCGPTGSGKTTTLYAALRERSTPGVKVVTVEDPVEYRLDGIVQLPVNARAGFGFPNALRAILRHDPDVILFGEMRDAETADIAVQAALTGHLVLSTVHTTDATAALARLQEMGVPPYLLSATLQGVLAQRLVRRVCESCGTWRPLTEHERVRVAASGAMVTQLREGTGCALCAGTGFRGRVAIAELLVLDDALRSAFTQGASLVELRAMVRARGVRSLREDGWRCVAAGETTIDEVVRMVSEDDGA